MEGGRGEKEGLGNSQRGEVAWLEEHEIPYVRWDITEFVNQAAALARDKLPPSITPGAVWQPASSRKLSVTTADKVTATANKLTRKMSKLRMHGLNELTRKPSTL